MFRSRGRIDQKEHGVEWPEAKRGVGRQEGVSREGDTRSWHPSLLGLGFAEAAAPSAVFEKNVCNISKNVKSHVSLIFKKKNVKNVKKRNHLG